MTWEIVTGLIALGGFLITFCTVISKNTAAMVELKTTLKEFREHYQKAHTVLESRVTKHGEEIDNHAARITRLEDWREMKEKED